MKLICRVAALALPLVHATEAYPQTIRQVVVEEASERLLVVPPEFQTVYERVLVEESHCEGDILQLTGEDIVISPGYEMLDVVPAAYAMVPERLVLREAVRGWRQLADGAFTFVDQPAEIRTVMSRVLRKSASTRRIAIPPELRRLQRKVVVSRNPVACPQPSAPKYRTVQRRVLKTPAMVRRVSVPARTATITTLGSVETVADVPEGLPEKPLEGAVYAPLDATSESATVPCKEFQIFASGDSASQPGDFPWPPPLPSTRRTFPDRYFDKARTLDEVSETIDSALDALGYLERSYYVIPFGFAVATQLEQINDELRPHPVDRWSTDILPADPPGILGWVASLFQAPVGRFRVIVFVSTSVSLKDSSPSANRDEAIGWVKNGDDRLDPRLAACGYSNEHRVTALIYEFLKEGVGDAILVKNTDPAKHLAGSGLSAALREATNQ